MNITPAELNSLSADTYILYDIRAKTEREYGFIPNSVSISKDELLSLSPSDRKIIVYCAGGIMSEEVVSEMRSNGLDAYNLAGGYAGWLRDDLSRRNEQKTQADVEQSIRKKYRDRLMKPFTKALKLYKLVNEGDRVAVCISGGKDSMLMAKLFQELKRHSEVNFDVKYLVMNPGYNEANLEIIKNNARILGIPIEIRETDIFASVYNVKKSPCYLCARMRRGWLYTFAKELGCNKIALGHHFDDVIETILMGMLHGAQIQTMMPKLHSTNFEGMELIRPMYFIREDDIKSWRDYNNLHFLQCACKFTDTCTTCNDGQNKSKRQETKELIRELKKTNPDVEMCIFRSMENVNIDTCLTYKHNGVKHSFLETYDEDN